MSKTLIINKQRVIESLDHINSNDDLQKLRTELSQFKNNFVPPRQTDVDNSGILNIAENGDTITIEQKYLLDEIKQIEETQTLERTKYYIERLKKGIAEIKTAKINDINLNRWKEYDEILTDSLWVLSKRDSSGPHSAWFWGNFIPQIPHQMILRYTKKFECVLDPFVGSGTTLIECKRLNRNGIGIELQPEIASKATEQISKWKKSESNVFIEIGDSTKLNYQKLLKKCGTKSVQLLLMHPPYHDIIKFSDNPNDLSNQKSTQSFVDLFCSVVEKTYDILDAGRYLILVIGDKYSKGEWIPLGFILMQEVMKRGYSLKSIVVKNFDETTAKRNQKDLWRYRALVGGFYIFKHEYIFVFKKNNKSIR